MHVLVNVNPQNDKIKGSSVSVLLMRYPAQKD